MPIEISNGIRLEPLQFEAHFNLLQPGPAVNPLPIDPVYQLEKCWCWAACMSMVIEYQGKSVSQCQIVGKKIGGTADVCSDPDSYLDEDCLPQDITPAWASWHINSVEHLGNMDQPAQISSIEVKQQIAEKQPVEVGIQWYQGGSHAVIIKGWSGEEGNATLWINDPSEESLLGSAIKGGHGPLRYRELQEGFGYGVWVHSWTEIKP